MTRQKVHALKTTERLPVRRWLYGLDSDQICSSLTLARPAQKARRVAARTDQKAGRERGPPARILLSPPGPAYVARALCGPAKHHLRPRRVSFTMRATRAADAYFNFFDEKQRLPPTISDSALRFKDFIGDCL